MNRVHVRGKTYEYPRHDFTNASDEVRRMFTDGCERVTRRRG